MATTQIAFWIDFFQRILCFCWMGSMACLCLFRAVLYQLSYLTGPWFFSSFFDVQSDRFDFNAPDREKNGCRLSQTTGVSW
jgi:hypothetical protein